MTKAGGYVTPSFYTGRWQACVYVEFKTVLADYQTHLLFNRLINTTSQSETTWSRQASEIMSICLTKLEQIKSLAGHYELNVCVSSKVIC